MKIEDIDKNFRPASIGNETFELRDVNDAPFVVEGFPWRGKDDHGRFFRLPERMKGKVTDGAWYLQGQTAGGAVRFRTNSAKISIRAELVDSEDMSHMPRAGSAGFDIYAGVGKHAFHWNTAQPGPGQKVLEMLLVSEAPGGMADWQINMPLYGGVQKLEVGLLPGSVLEAPTPHKISKPILFYGSSITQGGCASRPGNAYSSMLCRTLDAEQVNLGFSGNGVGEAAVAELIAELDLAAFVMDYDHNAPNVEHLQKTHEAFFRIIREKHPDLPVIILSKCNIWPNVHNARLQTDMQRREVIFQTFRNARAAGDAHVYFIDGESLFGKRNRNDCTVDTCHPNDLGFYRMYKHVLPVLKDVVRS